jgi:HAD superfamily hydrolase (TIGR01509 family)
MIRGVLFDMDGVLVDSEEFICKAAMMMFREMGIAAKPEDFSPFVGMGENKYLGGVAEKYKISLNIDTAKARTYEIYKEIVRGRLKPLPGVHEFIASCRRKELRLALATSADRVKMLVNLREIGLTTGSFHATVNGLDVERKKPFPDIYIKAAGDLGFEPQECLVAEDAPSGVRAAKAAGCRCLALTTSFGSEVLREADWICNDLSDAPEDALAW